MYIAHATNLLQQKCRNLDFTTTDRNKQFPKINIIPLVNKHFAGPSEATEKWGVKTQKWGGRNQILAEICLLLTNFALFS